MPGTFVFRPIEANLTHDTDWLGKMDPYCAYLVNNKRVKGQVCKKGGQHPIWSESTSIPMEVDQPACVVELMDKDKFIDDSIGTFVIDLNEVRNYGSVSKWYPVFHKNKPAGQILFETAFQGQQQLVQPTIIQPIIKETILVEEVPKQTMVQETFVQSEILPQKNIQSGGFLSQGGSIPMGGETLDGPLYGKVVGHQAIRNLPDQHFGTTGLANESLPRTNIGGPLSGSLGGGVLGTSSLIGNQIPQNTQFVQEPFIGTQPLSNQSLNTQPMMNQQQFGTQPNTNLMNNFASTQMSNAQLGGGNALYKETANHPTANLDKNLGKHLPTAQGNLVPGDLVGGHNLTNENKFNQNL